MNRLRDPRKTLAVIALASFLLALGGCGSTSSTTQPRPTTNAASTASTASTRGHKTPIAIAITAIAGTGKKDLPIPSRYTCDGANVSPELRWDSPPAGTQELVLFALHLDNGYRYDWAVAGLKPTLTELTAGSLPPGAALGRNSHGHDAYSVCPRKGVKQLSGIFIFAMPHRTGLHKGFVPKALLAQANREAIGEGEFGFLYKRR